MTQVSSPVTHEAPKIPTATVTPFETKPTPHVEPAGDFNEDPFKNYRYEDPFLISDPFQDEAPTAAPAATKGRAFHEIPMQINLKLVRFVTEMNAEPKAAENFFDKFSFDEAGDPFASEKFATVTNGNDGNNNSDFDPFGAPVAVTNKDATTGFGFEADFTKFDPFNDTGVSTKTNGSSIDAWGSTLDKKNNNNSFGKIQKFSKQEVTKNNKFSADYSDNYEQDMQQALKRSVMDQ